MKRAVFIVLTVGLLTASLSVFIQIRRAGGQIFAVATSSPATAGVGSSFNAAGMPTRLIIPRIGIDAHVQSVGLSWRGNGDMEIPTNFTDVAWYNGGPRPGMPGSAVIDGHLDGKDVPQAVFYNLKLLQPGDLVEVVDDTGDVLQFRVVGSKIYGYDTTTTDIFSGDTSKAGLNLITCTGDWDKNEKIYTERLVVFTERVSID
jgi:LPXTG-site transpeptidase (sortase) family protein